MMFFWLFHFTWTVTRWMKVKLLVQDHTAIEIIYASAEVAGWFMSLGGGSALSALPQPSQSLLPSSLFWGAAGISLNYWWIPLFAILALPLSSINLIKRMWQFISLFSYSGLIFCPVFILIGSEVHKRVLESTYVLDCCKFLTFLWQSGVRFLNLT